MVVEEEHFPVVNCNLLSKDDNDHDIDDKVACRFCFGKQETNRL